SWAMLQFQQGSPIYFWIPLAILVIALAGTIAYVNSRAGQYAQAIRDDETAAASLGVDVLRYRLVAVAFSCGLSAVAGAYYTQYYFFVGPEQAFGSSVSILAIVPAVIGGIGTIWGPVVGALVVGPLSEAIASLLRDPPGFLAFLEGLTGLDVAVYAFLLIAIVLFMPRGIYGTLKERLKR
ncbi:MAG: branched-chain amino acid ABC transporter permease, partial [Ornithinimicrobium sp.]